MIKNEIMVADGCSIGIASSTPKKPLKKRKWKSVQWLCFGLALIPIISFAIFNGVPVVLSFISMFTNMENNDLTTMEWNAFQNFVEVFRDERFWNAWKTTFWLATAQIVTMVIALIISVLLDQKVKGAKIMQVLFFIPYICSSVAVAIMWQWVFSKDFGILNSILGTNIDWLNDAQHPSRLVWCVYITIVWSAPAYGIVMFKAALKNVNPSLYEAAEQTRSKSFCTSLFPESNPSRCSCFWRALQTVLPSLMRSRCWHPFPGQGSPDPETPVLRSTTTFISKAYSRARWSMLR